MPSITTHYIHSNEVLKKLDKEVLNTFNDNILIYNTFAQSHDYLYFCKLCKNSKEINKLASMGHHSKTRDFLINMISYIKDNKLESNSELISCLYGYICHYVLDITCHPYIFYKTGVYRKNKKTRKYKGEHNHIEKDLDALYYEKYYEKKYNKCNLNRDIIKKPRFTNNLDDMLDYVYNKTYKVDNVSKYYKIGIKRYKLLNTLVVDDYLGIKRLFPLLLDTVTSHSFGYTASYSTFLINPKKEWLNLEHNKWCNPANKDLEFTYSFDDLFMIAIKDAANIISNIHEVLFNNKDISILDKLILDLDYSCGLPCNNHGTLKYFEY